MVGAEEKALCVAASTRPLGRGLCCPCNVTSIIRCNPIMRVFHMCDSSFIRPVPAQPMSLAPAVPTFASASAPPNPPEKSPVRASPHQTFAAFPAETTAALCTEKLTL